MIHRSASQTPLEKDPEASAPAHPGAFIHGHECSREADVTPAVAHPSSCVQDRTRPDLSQLLAPSSKYHWNFTGGQPHPEGDQEGLLGNGSA